jgi:hypothetical protein
MVFASTALTVITLVIDAVLLTAVVAGAIYAYRRMHKRDD